MEKNRIKLPYRKNCEGYFFINQKILAQKRNSYIEFPGGGIDENETDAQAIIRETFEETGAIIKNLKKMGVIYFDWDKNWAKTEKQKLRYKHFRGEEMHLFKGEIEELKEASGDNYEKGWKGEKLMQIKEAVKMLESMKPFPENMTKYYSKQLQIIEKFL